MRPRAIYCTVQIVTMNLDKVVGAQFIGLLKHPLWTWRMHQSSLHKQEASG